MRVPLEYSIHTSSHPAARFAADELGRYLTQLWHAAPSRRGYPFHITCGQSEGEAFTISVLEDHTDIEAQSPRAAVYAVYTFLTDYLGCLFLAEDCEILPQNGGGLTPGRRRYAPAFAYREAYWRGAIDGRFALQCRLNSSRADIPDAWGGRVMFYNYSHTFEQLVPPQTWFDSHPEYFSFFDGKRQRFSSQLCLSNPDVLKLCIGGVKAWMRQNPAHRIFSVAQNDWYGYCQCPACQAIDQAEGSRAGSLIRFVNAVADAVKDEFPGNFIHTFAYMYSRKPPQKTKPRDNVIIRLCDIENCFSHPLDACHHAVSAVDVETAASTPFAPEVRRFTDDLLGWSQITKNLYIWDYTVSFSHYLLPFPNLSVLQENLRLFRGRGVSGVFEQGNYSLGRASALGPLKIYLLSNLLWNPDAEVKKLISEFVSGYYGESAAPHMLSYIALLEQSAAGSHMSIYDQPSAPYFRDGWLEQADAMLSQAEKAASYEEYRTRVRRERLSVTYAILTRLPLDAPNRRERIEAFGQAVRELGITEIFERRALDASLASLQDSRYASAHDEVPYTVYRI